MHQKSIIRQEFTLTVAGLLIGGTCGYVLIEGWPVIDSLFMTIITLSTVGYGETQELSQAGRIFTSLLIGLSVICMACWTATITSVFVSGNLSGRFAQQKEKKMISQLTGHTVVCGGGIIARTVIEKLVREKKKVVAVISNPDEIQWVRRLYPDVPIVEDDPKSELALADANAIAAANLVAASEEDYDNLLIAITGRGLGVELRVICCSQSTELASRMFKIGADEVICPLVLGGERVAKLIA